MVVLFLSCWSKYEGCLYYLSATRVSWHPHKNGFLTRLFPFQHAEGCNIFFRWKAERDTADLSLLVYPQRLHLLGAVLYLLSLTVFPKLKSRVISLVYISCLNLPRLKILSGF